MPTAHLQTSGPVEWMTLEASAKLLNKSERTLLQWVKDGKIKGKRERDPSKRGQETTFLHAGDVLRIADEIEHAKKDGSALVRKSASPQSALLHTSDNQEVPDEDGAPPASPWPWLNLEQAANYGRRPKRWLLAQIALPEPARSIVVCDVGPGPGGRWMFHRESLERC